MHAFIPQPNGLVSRDKGEVVGEEESSRYKVRNTRFRVRKRKEL